MSILIFICKMIAYIFAIIVILGLVCGILNLCWIAITDIYEIFFKDIVMKLKEYCKNKNITSGKMIVFFLIGLGILGLIANLLEAIFGRNII